MGNKDDKEFGFLILTVDLEEVYLFVEDGVY